MDMFSVELEQAQATPAKTFYDYAIVGDKSGALKHLQGLAGMDANIEILEAGFSSIYGRNTDKSDLISHALRQIGVKSPVRMHVR